MTSTLVRVRCSECLHDFVEHLDLVGCLHSTETPNGSLTCVCSGFNAQ